MIIDLSKLYYSNVYKIEIDDSVKIDEEYLKNTDIRKISPVKVNGFISDNEEELMLNINISGTMILPCARTLKDVSYPFSIDIEEEITENNDNSLKIVQNKLDIFPIIWQNILVDVPLRVLSPDSDNEILSGDGWKVITEDEEKEEIDPRLKALSNFNKE